MKRLLVILAVFSVFVAACSGATIEPESGADTDTTGVESTDSSSGASSSTDAASSDASTSATESKPPLDGPAAPNFTLALQPSGEFVLSQEVKPVYMVFWAEW